MKFERWCGETGGVVDVGGGVGRGMGDSVSVGGYGCGIFRTHVKSGSFEGWVATHVSAGGSKNGGA